MDDRSSADGQLAMFEHQASAASDAAAPVRPAAVRLALPEPLHDRRHLLRLGTSSWSFAGWCGRVYDGSGPPPDESRLSRDGLPAYASHPLLGAVGIDRGFYSPLSAQDFARYAAQVPPGFRFLVKAPARLTDAVRRDTHGRGVEPNPHYLDAALAAESFARPAIDGLGAALGTLLLQCSPLPSGILADVPAWIAKLYRFLAALPRGLPDGAGWALEVRDAALLTPRLMDALRDADVGYCVAVHPRMPPLERQFRALDHHERGTRGPLIVRWSLHDGLDYAAARRRYAPFDALVDPDPAVREAIAERAAATLAAGWTVTAIANNKAEGSAPLTLQALAREIAAHVDAAG
jgi:uncharacterized protein YecE (DUF72 family)